MNTRIILSLFDHSGNWSRPYREAGFDVVQVDKKLGIDILTWDYTKIPNVNICLIACPCTDYALSGAKHFFRKDHDGTTEESQKLVAKVKEILDYFKPEIWVLENPMSRIHKLNTWLGEVKYKFHPYEFAGIDEASAYQKETWLWGKFNKPIKKPLSNPGFLTGIKNNGQVLFKKYGGKSERTKELRSITPLGFAYAFYEANH